jgi:hypothetical protein
LHHCEGQVSAKLERDVVVQSTLFAWAIARLQTPLLR